MASSVKVSVGDRGRVVGDDSCHCYFFILDGRDYSFVTSHRKDFLSFYSPDKFRPTQSLLNLTFRVEHHSYHIPPFGLVASSKLFPYLLNYLQTRET